MRLLILIPIFSPAFQDHAEAIRQTWDSVLCDGMQTIYAYATGKSDLDERSVALSCRAPTFHEWHDGWTDMFLPMLNFAYSSLEFDYVLITNASSYWNKRLLKDKLSSLPAERCIATHIDGYVASGAGVILSWDVVEYVLDHQDQWNHDLASDAALSKIAMQYQDEYIHLDRANYCEGPHQANADDIARHYHFRCKALVDDGTRKDATPTDRSGDIAIMTKIFELTPERMK